MPKHKLDEFSTARLLKLYQEGMNQYEVAKVLGVAQSTVSRVLDKHPIVRRAYTYKEKPLTQELGHMTQGVGDDAA